MKYDAISNIIMLRRSSSSSPTSCDHSKDRQEYSSSIMPSSISNLSSSSSSPSSELRKSIRISYNYDNDREVDRSHDDSRRVPDSSHSHSCQPDSTYVKAFHIRKQGTVLLLCYLASLLAFSVLPGTVGIDCFKCVSLNGDNPSCEDPFHNNYSVSILESPCMGGRKGRNGLFPATACIKLAGRYWDTGESMVVRSCSVDSGTLTLDTELVRMSHCGFFYFDDRYVKGCLQSCDDADGCNGSSRPNHFSAITIILIIPLVLLISSITLPLYFLPNLAFCFHPGGATRRRLL